MKSPWRVRKSALVGLALIASAPILIASASTARAEDAPLVTDYANYPSPAVSGAPAGCDASSFINPMYTTSNGGTGPDLHALPTLRVGDSVTFTWSGIAPGCDAAQTKVTLAVKAAKSTMFNPADTQQDVAHVTVPGTANSVTIVMPSLFGHEGNCSYQLDAVMGYALAVVGPTGSYYSAAIRGDNQRSMLASSQLGQYPTCEAPATLPSSPLPAPTVTTSQVLPAVLPNSTAPPASSSVAGQAVSGTQTAGIQASGAPATGSQAPGIATEVQGIRVTAGQAVIPTTGANTRPTFILGLAALFSGMALLSLPNVRRFRARSQSS